MAPFSLWFLHFLVLGSYGAKHDKLVMSPSEAKSFVRKTRDWLGKDLKHECYSEGCRLEEVTEVIKDKETAYEYYYTYTCNKFGQNCKVPCTYREKCTVGEWSSWEGNVKARTPGCYKQTRTKPYEYPLQTRMRRISCSGLNINCNRPPVEERMQCVCRKATCELGSWEDWTGQIEMSSCGIQTRIRPYVLTWSLEQQTGSCRGMQSSCPDPETDLRNKCNCSRAECTLTDWGEWEGSPEEGNCVEQKRRRSYTETVLYELHSEKCPKIPQECPADHVENRTMCKCSYVKCTLGNWSDWEPRELKHAKCGQRQTRRKTYSLTWAYQLHRDNCTSMPQECPNGVIENRTQCKCLYRDSCQLEEWSEWDNPLDGEGCKTQIRNRSYVYPLKQAIREDCSDLLTSCVSEPKETRNYCKCKYVQCTLAADWSDWSRPVLTEGQCGKERRTKDYIEVGNYSFAENCNGLATSCPAGLEQTRTVCKCPYVTCDVGDWNPWKGALPTDGCTQQIRTKNVTERKLAKMQFDDCGGLQTTCPAIPPDLRQWCNCSFREDCELNNWSDWSGHVPVGGCAVQMRTREYNKPLDWLERKTCDGLESCPSIKEETRTKCRCNEIICEWGNWTRTSFNPETNCYQEMRVKNESRGFNVVPKLGNCDNITIECSESEIEKREDCISGGGENIHTIPPPTTSPSITTETPTTAFQPATYVSLGCFADSSKRPRPLPILIANKRSQIDWYNLKKTIQACAEEARQRRLEYFSVQFFGECWSGKNAGKTFFRDGPSDQCYEGVGRRMTNAVYRIEDLPECSSELSFTASGSTGQVNGGQWCAGNTEEYQWIAADFGGERKISGVGTQGGNKESWVTLFTLEWSEEGNSWETYKEDGYDKVFAGNSDRFTLETRWLKQPINARFLRFRPKSWTSTYVCMKITIYGCSV